MIKLRQASLLDCDMYYAWTQDVGVREFAFNQEPISYKNHCQWFQNKVESSDSLLLVGEVEGKPCGQIRFDKQEGRLLISFSVASEWRGKGVSKELLREGSKVCRKTLVEEIPIEGVVMSANIASVRAFQGAQFEEVKHFQKNQIDCILFRAPKF